MHQYSCVYKTFRTLSILLCCIALLGCKNSTNKTPHKSHNAHKKTDTHTDHAHHHEQADPNTISKDQSGQGMSEQKRFFVKFAPSINPIPFQGLFSLKVEVFDGKDQKTPAASVKLDEVQALMPAHKHGMKVKPTIKANGAGSFDVDGMRFHMQGKGDDGKWVLKLTLNDGTHVDTFSYDLQCCR